MTAVAPLRRDALGAVARAGMSVFGIVIALFGAVMPVLLDRLSLGLADVGLVFLVTNGAMLGASVVVGPAMDRVGMKAPLVLGALLVASALVAIAHVPTLRALLAAAAALGFGGGMLNAGTNTLVADLYDDPAAKASALNVLGAFYGVGALLLPASVGALLSRVGLLPLMGTAAALCAVIAAATAALAFPAPKQARGVPLAQVRRFLDAPLVPLLAGLLFFESGNEFLLGGYFSTFATGVLGMPVERASYLLAGYWAAITLSRLALGRIVLLAGTYPVLLGGAVVASAGAIAVATAHDGTLATIGILVTGLALAGIFPTVLGLAAAAFPNHSGTVFGILFTAALTGGMTLPWLAGHLAAAAGLRAVFVMAAGSFLAVAGFIAIARRGAS
jgi:FHS family glucose/mannose:H+ symporter-like MFS transporter